MKSEIRNEIMIAYFIYLVVKGFSFFINLLPETTSLWIGRQIGRLLYFLDSEHRRVAFQNLRQAFGNEKSEKELRAIAQRTFQNLGMMVAEFFRIPKMKVDDYKRQVAVEGLEEALKIKNADIAESLDGLPPVKMHCSVLAEDALKAAIEDYKKKR